MSLTRREFLGTSAAIAATASAAESQMPTRTFGKTGARISIIGFGSGSRWLAYKDEDEALAAMERALNAGVNYIDTAQSYGNGLSETRVGKLMPKWRKKVWLTTKVEPRGYDEAMRSIEASLKRLNTDQTDLMHMHSLTDEADLAKIEAPNGMLKAMQAAKDQKMTRFIGVTCHADPRVLAKLLDRHDLDCTQMALNAAKAGMVEGVSGLGEKHPYSFEATALPVARRKNMGVTAMKIFAQEKLNGKASIKQLIEYALSLPVASAVLGMPKVEYIDENIAVAKAFKPMPSDEMRRISDELSAAHKASIDEFFRHHIDA